jgi:hypothetical protein
MAATKSDKAVQAIDTAGILLVYPIKNEREPPSLWFKLHPRSRMSWDWADTADNRVVDLWHLRTELSQGGEVVYAKWLRGRATFFSRPVFTAMLRLMRSAARERELSGDAERLYHLLLDDSPQTPRMLRAALGLEGRIYEAAFNRALRELWQQLLIVGYGEVDEGAFPALAIGATRHLFEDLWQDAQELDEAAARRTFETHAPPGSAFHKQLTKLRRDPGSERSRSAETAQR